jgi:signal transduction histidine kinase
LRRTTSFCADAGEGALTEILRIPVDRELGVRVRWLITLRWMALGLALAAVVVSNVWLEGVLPLGALGVVLAAIAGYNTLFWVLAHRMTSPAAPYESHTSLLHAQLIIDLLALTTLLHFAGGLENPFSTFYVILVLIGSILATRRASFAYAGLATALWAGLMLLEATGVIPHHNLAGFRLPVRYREGIHIVANALVLGGANFGVAYLASSIIERLREGERQLYDANASCEIRAGELAELNARLQELDHTRSLFIRLVTHELRAPVAAIQSYLRLYLDGYVPQERLHEILTKAEQRARDQLDLISDLLDLARVQEDHDRTKAVPVDVSAVLNDVVDLMQARIDDKRLDLTVDLPSTPSCVMADPEHIKQVWTNLISNAVKYTPDDGKISVCLQQRDNLVCGTVTDTGIGIAPEDMQHIFETFYRTEKAKAMAHHGTGLGLSIVKGLTERYGGRVWVESEIGKGSTFAFELPTIAMPVGPKTTQRA